MPYTKHVWVNGGVPAINATHLNEMETGIAAAPYGPDGASGFAPVGDGSGAWVYKKITNAEIDVAAAIAYSKLALGNSIVNADISGSAAIALSKLASDPTGKPLGLTGATAATRYVGATASGAPASGTFAVGDFSIDQTGKVYVCTVAGSPGTWVQAGGGSSPGTELDYKQITTDSASITATTEGTAAAVITGNSITYDGTRVKIEFWAPQQIASAAGITISYVILRDITVVGQAQASLSASGEAAVKVEAFETPSAGAHTYKVSAFVSSGNVVVKAGAGGSGNFVPAFLRVTKA